jgi:hypothetical protein
MKTISARNIKTWILAIGMTAFVGGAAVTIVSPQATYAAQTTCTASFLGFPAWYRGLTNPHPDCSIKAPGTGKDGLSNFIWTIVLNIIDIGLRLVGYIAVIFVLYGGFLFLTSNGDPSNAAKARKTILDAVIGIVISIASIAIVNLIIRFV